MTGDIGLKIKKGYKLVYVGGHGLYSYTIWHGPYGIKYELNYWVERKEGNGPLAVFDSLEDAQSFIGAQNEVSWAVYSCEYTPSKDKFLWFIDKCGNTHIAHGIPHGTRFADKVKLLERVKGFCWKDF